MDNLTHSLVGALIGQMGLKRKTGLAMPTLIIAANIPDIDAAAVLLGGHQHLAIRRGITHGPIAMVVLPLLLWGAMLWFDAWQTKRGKRPEKRLPVHKGWLLALAFIGCLSHPLFDWLNSYGIRLLEPLSSQWFYGDTLFIVDVWIWIALITGVWVSLRRERRGQGNWPRPAWIGFAAICVYIFANGVITRYAEAITRQKLLEPTLVDVSVPEPLVIANPIPVVFWRREILWRDTDTYVGGVEMKNSKQLRLPKSVIRYGEGVFNIFTGLRLNPDYEKVNVNNIDLVQVSKSESELAAYLFWSRMPVTTVEGKDDERQLVISDQRFSDPRVRGRFTVSIPWKGHSE